MLIGASLVGTWLLVAEGSSDLDDNSQITPSQTVLVESSIRDASAEATLVVSFRTEPVPAQVSGRLTAVAETLPLPLPSQGIVWGKVDGRPRVLVGSARSFSFHRDLGRGSRGTDVEVLQEFLADLGFYNGAVDGRFGSGVEVALVDYRGSIDASTDDKVLAVGDLVFVDPEPVFEFADLIVGSSLDPASNVGYLRSSEPDLELRFFPRDAALVVEGSGVSGEAFDGEVSSIDVEPLAVEGSTIRTGDVAGTLVRPVAVGEVLQVTVVVDAEPRLWIPLGSLALNDVGDAFAVTPAGEQLVLQIGEESGGFAEILSGAAVNTEVLLPNPELFADP